MTCLSDTNCIAVGRSDNRAMIQRWKGTTWSIDPDPVGASQSGLDGVACATGTDCFAVGQYHVPGASPLRSLARRWNGTAWANNPVPSPVGATDTHLAGIDCPAATVCFAVGAATVSGAEKTLVERWNGTAWAPMISPNVAGQPHNALADVDCTSATSCVAVGTTTTAGNTVQTLVERFNGFGWTVAPGSVVGALRGVSCATATDRLGVGSVTLHWNGTTWNSIAAADPPSDTGIFETAAVVCPAVNDCTAVGTADDFYGPSPFAAHWDGTTWTSVTLPSPYPAASALDITCVSTADCTTVGNYFDWPIDHETLVDHFDGTTWTTAASPNPVEGATSRRRVSRARAPRPASRSAARSRTRCNGR